MCAIAVISWLDTQASSINDGVCASGNNSITFPPTSLPQIDLIRSRKVFVNI